MKLYKGIDNIAIEKGDYITVFDQNEEQLLDRSKVTNMNEHLKERVKILLENGISLLIESE